MHTFILLLTSVLLIGSAIAQDEQEMNDKASALTKLTAHVDAAVIYSPEGRTQGDQALLDSAFKDNPTLWPLLGGHAFRLLRGEKGVLVLVCTRDGVSALLEDLSCTPGMDRAHWHQEPLRECEFTLSASACQ